MNRIQQDLEELKLLIEKKDNRKISANRIEAIEKKIDRIEKRLVESPNAFDLARDFTWHELKNICVKVKHIIYLFIYIIH